MITADAGDIPVLVMLWPGRWVLGVAYSGPDRHGLYWIETRDLAGQCLGESLWPIGLDMAFLGPVLP